MALRGKALPIELLPGRNPERKSDLGLVVLRQDIWGERNGETYLQVWDWDALLRHKLPSPHHEGAMDKSSLLALARAALTMAGETELAKRVLSIYTERVQSVRGRR